MVIVARAHAFSQFGLVPTQRMVKKIVSHRFIISVIVRDYYEFCIQIKLYRVCYCSYT